jgi:Zn-dependent protease/CBS domain-containing protein
MKSGFRAARLFGIDIFIDWSWLLIFLLVTWNLAASIFPAVHPSWSPALNLILALAASLLFFGSVLAHELAHSIVATWRGLPVRSITLFIFGGVSNIEREPASPGTEFLVAIVGPLTSLVLGAVLLMLGAVLAGNLHPPGGNVTQLLAGLGPVATLLLWLGPVNIVLGVFNLVPGFPLDGGRVLRSILWAISHNLGLATRWATWVGQAMAWLLIVAGIAMAFGYQLPFFGSGIVGGLWLAFIGWFMNNAASQSYQHVVVEDMLRGVPVARLMRANTPSVASNFPVSRLVDDYLMRDEDSAFPVVEGDRLVGLVSLEDVQKVPRQAWDTTLVSQIMTPASQLDLVSPREEVSAALSKLAQRDTSQLPVLEGGHLVGMLRQRDVMRWLQLQSHHA